MTLTELRYIIAVARERHFGHAADACFVSQPTLSVAIRKLEEELDVTLFERRRNDICITPVGEKIVEQAQKVLEHADVIKHIAHEEQDPLGTPLQLGVIYTVGPYLTPHLLPELNKLAPRMPLLIREDFTSNLTEALRHGEVDVIVISLPFEIPGITTRPVYDEPFILAMPGTHPWTAKKMIDPLELAGESVLLLGHGNCFRDQVLEVCPGCNTAGGALDGTVQKTLQGSSLETIRQMVASGAGITVLPGSSTCGNSGLDGLMSFRPFTKPVPKRTIAMAWRKSFPRMEAIEIIYRAIQASHIPSVKMAG
jgi:LysR family hydrogen peroxide-inducible transcriptional activator